MCSSAANDRTGIPGRLSQWPLPDPDSELIQVPRSLSTHLKDISFRLIFYSEPWFTSIKIRRYTVQYVVQCFNGDDANLCIRMVHSPHVNEEINVNKCQHFTGFWTLGKCLAAKLCIYFHLLLHVALNLQCSNKSFISNTNTQKTQSLHSERKQCVSFYSMKLAYFSPNSCQVLLLTPTHYLQQRARRHPQPVSFL